MYYDDFELPCGCRMHCGCDKVVYCPKCEKKQVAKVGTYYVFYCRECGTKVS